MEEQKSNDNNLVLSGIVIESRKSDNFINATQLCKAGGKKFNDWYRLENTTKLIQFLSMNTKNSALKVVDIKVGGNHSGSWIHPDLAVQLAQWISPSFAIQVSRWIRELFITGSVSINSRKTDEELKELQRKMEEKDKLLEEEREKISRLEKRQGKLESFVRTIKNLEKNQIFYLATTKNYAINNRFEYGGVKSEIELKKRIHGYNTGRAENDLMFYTKIFKCNNYKVIEDRVGNVLCQFKDKPDSTKEMVHLRYNLLVDIIEFICDNYDKEIEYVNSRCQQFLTETIEQDGIIPEEINLDEYLSDNMQIIVRRKNKEHIHKVDISDWDDEKISTTLEQIINLCATEKKNLKDYEFSKQKNSVALEITWGLLTPYLKLYEGITLMEWREKFREWFKKEKPTQLRIKGVKL